MHHMRVTPSGRRLPWAPVKSRRRFSGGITARANRKVIAGTEQIPSGYQSPKTPARSEFCIGVDGDGRNSNEGSRRWGHLAMGSSPFAVRRSSLFREWPVRQLAAVIPVRIDGVTPRRCWGTHAPPRRTCPRGPHQERPIIRVLQSPPRGITGVPQAT